MARTTSYVTVAPTTPPPTTSTTRDYATKGGGIITLTPDQYKKLEGQSTADKSRDEVLALVGETTQQAEIRVRKARTAVDVGSGSRKGQVSQLDFESLSTRDQTALKDIGIEEFNKMAMSEQIEAQTRARTPAISEGQKYIDYVTDLGSRDIDLGKAGMSDRGPFEGLSGTKKKSFIDLGFEGFRRQQITEQVNFERASKALTEGGYLTEEGVDAVSFLRKGGTERTLRDIGLSKSDIQRASNLSRVPAHSWWEAVPLTGTYKTGLRWEYDPVTGEKPGLTFWEGTQLAGLTAIDMAAVIAGIASFGAGTAAYTTARAAGGTALRSLARGGATTSRGLFEITGLPTGYRTIRAAPAAFRTIPGGIYRAGTTPLRPNIYGKLDTLVTGVPRVLDKLDYALGPGLGRVLGTTGRVTGRSIKSIYGVLEALEQPGTYSAAARVTVGSVGKGLDKLDYALGPGLGNVFRTTSTKIGGMAKSAYRGLEQADTFLGEGVPRAINIASRQTTEALSRAGIAYDKEVRLARNLNELFGSLPRPKTESTLDIVRRARVAYDKEVRLSRDLNTFFGSLPRVLPPTPFQTASYFFRPGFGARGLQVADTTLSSSFKSFSDAFVTSPKVVGKGVQGAGRLAVRGPIGTVKAPFRFISSFIPRTRRVSLDELLGFQRSSGPGAAPGGTIVTIPRDLVEGVRSIRGPVRTVRVTTPVRSFRPLAGRAAVVTTPIPLPVRTPEWFPVIEPDRDTRRRQAPRIRPGSDPSTRFQPRDFPTIGPFRFPDPDPGLGPDPFTPFDPAPIIEPFPETTRITTTRITTTTRSPRLPALPGFPTGVPSEGRERVPSLRRQRDTGLGIWGTAFSKVLGKGLAERLGGERSIVYGSVPPQGIQAFVQQDPASIESLVLQALQSGFTDPQQISVVTGVPVSEVSRILTKLQSGLNSQAIKMGYQVV